MLYYFCPVDYISIHALLAESDTGTLDPQKYDRNFYPRSPCGERRFSAGREFDTEENFYPRSPCGERPHKTRNNCIGCYISIHALLAESDFVVGDVMGKGLAISIHALLAESDMGFFLCF